MELSKSTPEYKKWAKYWRQNAKVGAAIVATEESEGVMLGLQESNELTYNYLAEQSCAKHVEET